MNEHYKEIHDEDGIYHVFDDTNDAWEASKLPQYKGWIICSYGNYENALWLPKAVIA